MKKVLLTMMAALLIVSVPASAQQRKTVKKATTTAKRTTPRKKAVSQPVTIQMDEPCIAGGALRVSKEISLSIGEGWGEAVQVCRIMDKSSVVVVIHRLWTKRVDIHRVTFTEKKFYNKAQVRKRVMAYKDAFEELSGCTAKENTMSWNSDEGGMVKIPINGGYIEINYANCDEVEFSSSDYTLFIVFSE